MGLENKEYKNKGKPLVGGEFAIDKLLSQFQLSIEDVACDTKKYARMLEILKIYNPNFAPTLSETKYPKAKVIADVVSGIYAPMIHGFATTIVKNIQQGNLPNVVIAPPRDAIPIAVAIDQQAKLHGCEVTILMPHVNRNIAGITNNQKANFSEKSPYLNLLLDQTILGMNGTTSAVEVETGIYGTTSLVMAEAFKSRKLKTYIPLKFYGLGPNLSYVHAILSGGKEWKAEDAEALGLVDSSQVKDLMLLLDTMEEMGMEKFYKSVEELHISEDGLVKPVIVPVTPEEYEIASTTNKVLVDTAPTYATIASYDVKHMLENVPLLVKYAHYGFPFTLTEAIPSMDSKEEHFATMRKSQLFDYPKLSL